MKTTAHILSYYPGREGLTSFCRGLGLAFEKEKNWSVPIISFRGKGSKNVMEREPPVLKFPHFAKHPFQIPASFLVALDSGELQFNGAVLHGTFSPQVFALARALKKRKIPYIFMPHDPYVDELMKHHAVRKWVYWHLCEKWVIKNAEAIQLLSADHEVPLRRMGAKTPVFTIANGCNPEDLKYIEGVAKTPGSGDEFVIQYLGRMDRNHKGLDLLLEGYANFLAKAGFDQQIVLKLSGNDWVDRPFLENLAEKLEITDHVQFTGRLPDHSLAIHAQADLSVLTSRFDGFGLTIVEAMLASRPVLVSSRAGIAEFVSKSGGGFVADPTSDGISKGLLNAWERKRELRKLGQLGHDYVLSNLTWKSIALKSSEKYHEFFS